jgi:hypothetical protein
LLPERLATRVLVDDNGCWLWQAAKTQKGYGMAPGTFAGERAAHRATYSLLVGPIPSGYEIDHLCRVTSCVNPQHLEAVTPQENRRRSPLAPERRTHCPQGHPYAGDNLKINDVGARCCRTCITARNARNYAERKAIRTP